MSLHLGNLSSRVRINELERVFRRFGRCSIQVRDKFGFIVYDYPVNAERALKTLQGKKICGEPLTLSWSNRQPRPVPRVRGRKSYDSRQGRNSRIENYVSQQDSRMGYKQPDNAKIYGMKKELEDSGVGPNENLLENDRWEEQIDEIPNGNDLENVSEFDRYEPYSGEDKRDDEISPTTEDVRQRKRDVQIGKSNLDHVVATKTQQGCYNCGELGHKMRNCPHERESKKTLNRFDHKRNNKINCNTKGEDELTIRSRYRKHHQTDYSRADNGTGNERMKRTREVGSPERDYTRKSRRPNSTSVHSDGKVVSRSKSGSKYSKPTTRLASNSNLNLKNRSLSSTSSTFGSKSLSHGSRNHRSRSRSGSRSRSSSRASLYMSTSSARSSTPSPTIGNPKLDTMDTSHIEKHEEEMVNHESEADSRSEKRGRVITSEEMLMVIKHYRLKKDDDDDKDLGVESFFGCGRLWPWEVIYYRRLKKGPISNENYARRISQNQEFGIVDKYVRSSSGWGEVDQNL